jgi:uncharacterized protein YdaU (DUF1376 family)
LTEQYSWSEEAILGSAKIGGRIEKAYFARIRFFASKGVLARRPMDPKITQEILDDLMPSLEALEAQSAAVLEFLKHEGMVSDEKLTPYLEQAANASNVRWRGVRVRIEHLLSAAEKASTEKLADKETKKPETTQTKAAQASQSQPEAGDNSKSAGPEHPHENTEKDKDAGTMQENTDSKLNVGANDSTRKIKNADGPPTSEDKSKSALTDVEQKVA